ncbi:MAG: 16S rRNA (cytidine(1402)-2'-O)-methyltransferase [Chloroflexi bacterium]|nr:16S rRNA (cytidine(1402)-2'-O)-methyltransferase [Chloroflexota bacterium]|tara:strand:- start:27822 stop:28649 length:828 start_codon:yes stop_codon:yes gene_type:complete
MGTLYVLSTPIGNLADLSERAKNILDNIEYVIAEDTRVSKKLFKNNKNNINIISIHKFSPNSKIKQVTNFLSKGDTVLLCDAGTPSISDPGNEVVKQAIESGHKVTPIPGPSAITAALSICPWPSNQFTFLGFLPRKENERKNSIKKINSTNGLIIIFESPHRISETFKNLEEILGDRLIFICRELTKIHEETFIGTSFEAREKFSKPKGEFTIIISGQDSKIEELSDEIILEEIHNARLNKMSGRKIVDHVTSMLSIKRSRVYSLELQSRKDKE